MHQPSRIQGPFIAGWDLFDNKAAENLIPQLLAKLAPEWASLPTLQSKSFYGQPVKKHQDLKAFYEKSLEQERRQAAGMGPISLLLS